MNVLPWMMRVWILVLVAAGTVLPALAQNQAGVPGLGDRASEVRNVSPNNSLAATVDDAPLISSDLVTKIILFVIFNVCVGMVLGMFKARLRMAFLLSLLLGPIGWILIIVFVKRPPESDDAGIM